MPSLRGYALVAYSLAWAAAMAPPLPGPDASFSKEALVSTARRLHICPSLPIPTVRSKVLVMAKQACKVHDGMNDYIKKGKIEDSTCNISPDESYAMSVCKDTGGSTCTCKVNAHIAKINSTLLVLRAVIISSEYSVAGRTWNLPLLLPSRMPGDPQLLITGPWTHHKNIAATDDGKWYELKGWQCPTSRESIGNVIPDYTIEGDGSVYVVHDKSEVVRHHIKPARTGFEDNDKWMLVLDKIKAGTGLISSCDFKDGGIKDKGVSARADCERDTTERVSSLMRFYEDKLQQATDYASRLQQRNYQGSHPRA